MFNESIGFRLALSKELIATSHGPNTWGDCRQSNATYRACIGSCQKEITVHFEFREWLGCFQQRFSGAHMHHRRGEKVCYRESQTGGCSGRKCDKRRCNAGQPCEHKHSSTSYRKRLHQLKRKHRRAVVAGLGYQCREWIRYTPVAPPTNARAAQVKSDQENTRQIILYRRGKFNDEMTSNSHMQLGINVSSYKYMPH